MSTRGVLVWSGVLLTVVVPLIAAANSPLLAWREPVYIAAGFAGVVGLAVLLCQPVLAAGLLPGLDRLRSRRLHRMLGIALVVSVAVHVIGLWLTSPPDVVDALLFASPTPFSVWGVIALWAVVAIAVLVGRRTHVRPGVWRRLHRGLAAVVVVGTVVHTLLIDGTMETVSKTLLCTAVLAVSGLVLSGYLPRR